MKRTSPNLVEHAGSGFLIPEATARRIDALARGLPRDFAYRRRSSPADLELDAGERTDVSTITTDALDRERECVLPGGGDWSAYNRVVPFAHDYRQLPAGSCWWIKPKNGSRLIAKTHYPAKPADWGDAPWLPSAVLHLMQQPVPACTGKSIGFLPLHIREASADELARRPELKGAPVIDRWIGIEYSVVPVPCNPEAEMLAVAKGVEAGIFDKAVAELITNAMTPFLIGWHSPLNLSAKTNEPETIALESSSTVSKASAEPARASSIIGGDGQAPADPGKNNSGESMPACSWCASEPGVSRPGAIRDAEAEKAAAIEQAASGSFVRPQTIRAAIRRALEDARAELPALIRTELREAYARATGKA